MSTHMSTSIDAAKVQARFEALRCSEEWQSTIFRCKGVVHFRDCAGSYLFQSSAKHFDVKSATTT